MKILKSLKYVFSPNILKIRKIFHYQRKYSLLARLMGFYQKPSLKFKFRLALEFLKYSYFRKGSDCNSVYNCVPRIFYTYYLSQKTGHYEHGYELIDKKIFYQVLDKNHLPYPLTYFIIQNGGFYDLFNNSVQSVKIDDQKTYFAKKRLGSAGKGATIVKGSNINVAKFEDYIFQEVCRNHEYINQIAPNKAFNTIRVHTYYSIQHDKMIILAAHLKLASSNSITDNIGAGGIGVEINPDTGSLAKYGFSELSRVSYICYPGSKHNFEDVILPFWIILVKELEKACRIFKSRLIGWDIGITDEGIVFIEGNSGSDIFIPQAFYRPFLSTLLISDHLASSKFHDWISKYEKKYKALVVRENQTDTDLSPLLNSH